MKATRKLTERKYYKKFSWIQPTLTSNGSFGGDEIGVEVGHIGGVTGFSGTAYTIFQPNTGTIYMDGDMYRTTLYLDIYIPHDFVITGFTFGNNYVTDASSGCYYSYLWGGTYKGETATQLAYKDSVGEGGSFRMDLGSNSRPYRYYRFQTSTYGSPYEDTMWFGKVLIEGYYIEEATSSDYDFYKDTYEYSIPITKTERKYYKIAIPQYVQPTNPNGITATSGWSNPTNAFDGNSSTYARCNSLTDYIEWDIGEDIYLTGVNTVGNWISGSAVATDW